MKLCLREQIGWILPPWLQSKSWHSASTISFPLVSACLCMSKTMRLMLSYHYLEHRAEDLGVLRHATDVELPWEDGRMVILILHVNEHLGCVSCKKQMAQYRFMKSLCKTTNKHTACTSSLCTYSRFATPSQSINWDTQAQKVFIFIASSCWIKTSLKSGGYQMLHNLASKLSHQYNFFMVISWSTTSKESLKSFPKIFCKLVISEKHHSIFSNKIPLASYQQF